MQRRSLLCECSQAAACSGCFGTDGVQEVVEGPRYRSPRCPVAQGRSGASQCAAGCQRMVQSVGAWLDAQTHHELLGPLGVDEGPAAMTPVGDACRLLVAAMAVASRRKTHLYPSAQRLAVHQMHRPFRWIVAQSQ